jgi:hypothetical protein
MMAGMIGTKMALTARPVAHIEPNHRQQMALERVEFAVGELASALMIYCRSAGVTDVAVRDIRKAVAPVLAEILSAD